LSKVDSSPQIQLKKNTPFPNPALKFNFFYTKVEIPNSGAIFSFAMQSLICPSDNRFFDVEDFNPTQHRVGPIGVFDDIRINLVLFIHPQPGLAFMYTRAQDRAFFNVDHEIPSDLYLRSPSGQWLRYTIPSFNFPHVKSASARAIKRMTGE
jgi:hypothetical protein